MNDENQLFTHAKVTAQFIIDRAEHITLEVIRDAIEQTCQLEDYQNVDRMKLVQALEMDNNIEYGPESIMADTRDHEPWLRSSGEPIEQEREIEWRFWMDYRQNLLSRGWPVKVINSIDKMSVEILCRLDDPLREGKWWRRGLVVGDVQSGKTANYISLICKAADSGYRVIVVLAGLHNSLRSQTQQRIDEDFIGFESDLDAQQWEDAHRIGVGRRPRHPVVHYVTTSGEKGDFSRRHAESTGLNLHSNDPKILIVKKNVSILKNLHKWAIRMGRMEGHEKIKGVPLLVIDDECDNASVNTGIVERDSEGRPVAEHDPTAINKWIRKFLNSFEQSAYIGYTATPFANVLIHRDGLHHDLGEDLFPRDFIVNLPKSSQYIGPEEVFGMKGDPDIGIEGSEAYPLYRVVRDNESSIPDKHKKDLKVDYLPGSMKEAIYSFILSCAAREARGQTNQHNSMLIHVTRFTNVQRQITEMVRDEIYNLRNRLRYGEGDAEQNIWEYLKNLWEGDFIRDTSVPMSRFGTEYGQVFNWGEIKDQIVPAIMKFEVKEINGVSGDILEYKKFRAKGINIIAIGGDKLSRGLTLEGLTVSYYLRSSRMYDTLMQMGRWFGYRPGYLDLCRIYTTSELISWYRYIALASLELRSEFDYMVENHEKPENYGLKIRSHPGALSVTSFNKMRNGTRMAVSFDGQMAQTLFLHNDEEKIRSNFYAVENLIRGYQSNIIKDIGYKFEHVGPEKIIDFLNEFKTHSKNIKYKPKNLISYIEKLNGYSELINWTVIVLSKKDGYLKSQTKIKGINDYLKLTERTAFEVNTDYISFEKALLSPNHEKLDLTSEEELAKLERYMNAKRRVGPKEIKSCRSPEKGLLLLYPVAGRQKQHNGLETSDKEYGRGKYPVFGYVISFPDSGEQRKVEYVVDSLYADELEVN